MTEKQENDVFYVCSLIEYIARKTKNHRQDACLNIVFAPIANQQSAYKKRSTKAERCLPIRKHRGAREKRYSFGYAVFLILALMK